MGDKEEKDEETTQIDRLKAYEDRIDVHTNFLGMIVGDCWIHGGKAFFIYLLSTTLWFALMAFLGAGAQRIWEDNHDHEKFWVAIYLVCGICLTYLMMGLFAPFCLRLTPRAFFAHATMTLCTVDKAGDLRLLTHSFNPQCGNWVLLKSLVCMDYNRAVGGSKKTDDWVKNRFVNVLYTSHCVCILITMYIWSVLSRNPEEGATSEAARYKASIGTIRTLSYIWVLLVPSFAAGVLDTLQLHLLREDTQNHTAHVLHRGMYQSYAMFLKGLMVAILILMLDPAANYYWEVTENVTSGEERAIWIFSMVILVMVIMFWTSYDVSHNATRPNSNDKAFAYAEFPAFLALTVAAGWHMSNRLRNGQMDVTDQAVGGEFVFHAAYIVLETINLMAVPGRLDYTTQVPYTNRQVSKSRYEPVPIAQSAFLLPIDKL
jgi:hypothetical protein